MIRPVIGKRCATITMGYDLNLLADGSVDDQFLCHICCGILQCPRVVVGCGHAFCQLCIDRWLEVKNRCPVYRCQQNELIIGGLTGILAITEKP